MKTFMQSLKVLALFTLLTGILYPLLVTAIVQVLFPVKANGSFVNSDGRVVGSSLIGQQFDSSIYFSSRPSAILYNPIPSGGSNLGITSAKLKLMADDRRRQFVHFNKLDSLTNVPAEMLFASASGLDPHISPQAARMQADRVARNRGFGYSEQLQLYRLIDSLTEKPQFLFLGESRVNVLLLNLETDRIK